MFIISFPGETSGLEFGVPDTAEWQGQFAFGRHISVISQVNYRLPPGAMTMPLTMKIHIRDPDAAIKIGVTLGADNTPPCRFELVQDMDRVRLAYEGFLSHYGNEALTHNDQHRFAGELLGIQPP